MKPIFIVLGILVIGGAVWYGIQTKPDEAVPVATVSDVNTTTEEKKMVTDENTSKTALSGKQVDNANVKIEFTGFGPGKKHVGSFSKVDSKLTIDDKGSMAGTVIVDVNSMSTDTEAVTKHLKTDAFFDAVKYPTATFVLLNVGEGKASGKLTTHGVTKDISFPVVKTDTEYKATFNIDMKEFGIDQKFANEVIELTVTVPLK